MARLRQKKKQKTAYHDQGTIGFRNSLDAEDVSSIRDAFDTALNSSLSSLVIDFSMVETIETIAAASILGGIHRLNKKGIKVQLKEIQPDLKQLLEKFGEYWRELPGKSHPGKIVKHFSGIGDDVVTTVDSLRALISFSRESLFSFLRTAIKPKLLRWGEVFYYMEQSGVKAVPIIAVICWLLGTVLGYMSGFQLKQFAAETFMPDLVGLSMVWEISPLLAAVLVAGRSSSAFAAEIGTMKVRQEVDALKVMGFDIYGFLVIPKVIALLFVMPFLTLLADIFGLLGGLLIGGWYLDMPPDIFFSRLETVLIPLDFYWGMLKSLVFAVIISIVGCSMGMRVRGGAAEVGRSTTSAVVTSIFLVILADALISILFMHVRPEIVL